MIRQLLTKIQFERITVMMETLGVVSLLFLMAHIVLRVLTSYVRLPSRTRSIARIPLG